MGFLVNSFIEFPSDGTDFSDYYNNSTGWTLSSNMSISGGSFHYNAAPFTPENSYKDMGITLSDTLWYADYDYQQTADSNTDNWAYGIHIFSAGTANPRISSSTDSISNQVIQNKSVFTYLLSARENTTNYNSAQSSAAAQDTRYYLRNLRTSATGITLQMFDDEDRTSTFSTALTRVIPSTITDLDTYQHATGTGTQTSNITANMLEIKVYDGVAP